METSAAPVLSENQPTTPVDSSDGERANPEEFRMSLETVRLVQETARARARRETLRARIFVLGGMALAGLVAWNVASRSSAATQPAIAAAPVAPIAGVAAPAPEQPVAPVTAPGAAAAAPAAPAAATAAEDVTACDSAFAERRWPSVLTACAAAFKVRPRDPAVAMRVAQAQHRRGNVAAAGDWARSAIALDDNIPEAYVILARAEAQAGHARSAAIAYRRYLTLAPRGWHASEARRALGR